MRTILVASALAMLGCTPADDSTTSPCLTTEGNDYHCLSARALAARYSPELIPSDAEVHLYHERWLRAIEAEPLLADAGAQWYRSVTSAFVLYTRNSLVVEAWKDLQLPEPEVVPTGDQQFDQLMSELIHPRLYTSLRDPSGSGVYRALVYTNAVINGEILHARLLPTDSHLDDANPIPDWPDIFAEWRDVAGTLETGTVQFDVRWGWGDCIAGCAYLHDFRAIVPPSGTATVYDMGGAPLPPHVQLSPNTKPPQ
jgi:hypothetical protein